MASDSFDSLPVDDLLAQLRDTPTGFIVKKQEPKDDATSLIPPVSTVPPTEEELGDYVIKKTTALVEQNMAAFRDIKDIAIATNDADTISALADVAKSISGSLELLNKIHLQNKKAKTAKEIATINAEAKRKQIETSPSTTNILAIGTREDVLKMLAEASKKIKDIPEIEIVDSTLTSTQIQKQ